uniref:type II toxin-antitoxin system RelE/ParE family toxin n=1 Tax=Castellaniella defragrans TaxID=75697 RepID=UPI003342D246
MTTKTDLLSEAALADIRGIIGYTRKAWGDAQVCRYVEKPSSAESPASLPSRPLLEYECHPSLRMAHCQHHDVFCLPHQNEPALIVAVLHEWMDLMRRLAERLGSI